MNKDNSKINISSFYLAVFLLVKDIQLVSIEKENPRRAVFIFKQSKEAEELVNTFNFDNKNNVDMNVNFRKVEETIKKLKQLLYD